MKKIFFSILTIALVLSACNEDEKLNQYPHNLTDRASYTTVNGALQGLIAAYEIMQWGEDVERVELVGTVCSGDALPGGEPGGGDQPNLQSAGRFLTNSDNIYMSTYWSSLYTGIYRCNLLLDYLSVPEDLIEFPEELRTRIMGEATFLRGLYHFKLQIYFGGYPQLQDDFNGQLKGVPFVDHVLLPEEWQQERPPLEETWSKIEDDFEAAAGLLPLRSEYDAADLGR
ncbi:MAG: RagB/SusD family nutrient uptake outer membrane protein, partial [Bacteroidales bacterium]